MQSRPVVAVVLAAIATACGPDPPLAGSSNRGRVSPSPTAEPISVPRVNRPNRLPAVPPERVALTVPRCQPRAGDGWAGWRLLWSNDMVVEAVIRAECPRCTSGRVRPDLESARRLLQDGHEVEAGLRVTQVLSATPGSRPPEVLELFTDYRGEFAGFIDYPPTDPSGHAGALWLDGPVVLFGYNAPHGRFAREQDALWVLRPCEAAGCIQPATDALRGAIRQELANAAQPGVQPDAELLRQTRRDVERIKSAGQYRAGLAGLASRGCGGMAALISVLDDRSDVPPMELVVDVANSGHTAWQSPYQVIDVIALVLAGMSGEYGCAPFGSDYVVEPTDPILARWRTSCVRFWRAYSRHHWL